MIERLNEDIKTCMKAKAKEKLDAIRYLKSMLLENKTAAKPRPQFDVLVAHLKKLKDSMESYPAGHEQREKIAVEIKCLEDYAPKGMTASEVEALVASIVKNLTKDGTAPQMGAVMKELSHQVKGRFDGKAANDIVQKALQK